MRLLLLHLIVLYQRYISPKKGFVCAYGVLHNNGSCSQLIFEIIRTKPFHQLPRLIIKQFKNCSLAYREINNKDEDKLNSGRCILLPRRTEKDEKEEKEKRKYNKCEYAAGTAACCLFMPFDI